MSITTRHILLDRLENFLANHTLQGLRRDKQRERFVRELSRGQAKLRALRQRRFKGSTDPARRNFHPLLAILEMFRRANRDEAIWLAFLCTHFGWDSKSTRAKDTVRLFYAKFGEGIWDWKTVSQNPTSVRTWLRKNWGKVKLLKFGNHRKFQSNDPAKPGATHAVMKSFVKCARNNGNGSSWEAFSSFARGAQSREEAFDRLYKNLDVRGFGRTGKFDLLCLLGNLGILTIAPSYCYLKGSTGPKGGALLMLTGRKGGRLSEGMEERTRELRDNLGVPVEALEDALCNWQKQKGFLSVTCP